MLEMYNITRKQKHQTTELSNWQRKDRQHGTLQEVGEKLVEQMENEQPRWEEKRESGFQKERGAIRSEIQPSICVWWVRKATPGFQWHKAHHQPWWEPSPVVGRAEVRTGRWQGSGRWGMDAAGKTSCQRSLGVKGSIREPAGWSLSYERRRAV